jgi:RND family efflux transporter MFP subunit
MGRGSILKSITVIGISLCLSSCGPGDQKPNAQSPPQVGVAKPVIKPVVEWDEFTGRFDAVAEVQVRARVNGYLQQVHFKDGATVQKGDLLFTIDPRPYEATLRRSQAEVARAEAKLALSGRELSRAERLVSSGSVAVAVEDQRNQAQKDSVASLDAAKAQLESDRLNVEFTRIRAPITGRISRKMVTEGNLVNGSGDGGTLLTTIVTLDPIYFYFDVDERNYIKYTRLSLAGLRPSSRDYENPVKVALADETDFSHDGVMDFVDNRIDRDSGTLRARALLANKDQLFSPGQFGRIRLLGSAAYEGILVPDEAVGSDQSRKVIHVVGPDNVVASHEVKLGPIYEGLRVIREGLKKDETIIISGLQRVRVGAPVSPMPKEIHALGQTEAGTVAAGTAGAGAGK